MRMSLCDILNIFRKKFYLGIRVKDSDPFGAKTCSQGFVLAG